MLEFIVWVALTHTAASVLRLNYELPYPCVAM